MRRKPQNGACSKGRTPELDKTMNLKAELVCNRRSLKIGNEKQEGESLILSVTSECCYGCGCIWFCTFFLFCFLCILFLSECDFYVLGDLCVSVLLISFWFVEALIVPSGGREPSRAVFGPPAQEKGAMLKQVSTVAWCSSTTILQFVCTLQFLYAFVFSPTLCCIEFGVTCLLFSILWKISFCLIMGNVLLQQFVL